MIMNQYINSRCVYGDLLIGSACLMCHELHAQSLCSVLPQESQDIHVQRQDQPGHVTQTVGNPLAI